MEHIKKTILQAVPLVGSRYKAKADFPVIFYHDVVQGKGFSVQEASLESFTRQMDFLKKHGYRTLLFSDLDALLTGRAAVDEKKVLVTFDDGYLSNFQLVLPLMQERGLNFNIFLNTRMVEEGEPEFMTVDMVKAMHRSGIVEFGSHTHSHINTNLVRKEELIHEVLACNSRLEKWLGYSPEDFCYPYGAYTARNHEVLARYYKRIYTSDAKPQEEINGAYVRGRVGIKTYDTDYTFKNKLAGNYDVMYLLYKRRYGKRSAHG